MTTRNRKSNERAITKNILGEPMTAEVHLVRTLWFRLAIIGPIAIALITGWLFTLDTNLQWSLTPKGMNNFLTLFKLPIGIASLSLPLAAVVAANHRSMQTAKQILEQNSQNVFANHLQHRSYFFKFIEDFKPFKDIEVSTPKLYENLFSMAVNGYLDPNKLALNGFLSDILATNSGINKELNAIFQNNEIIIESDEIKSLIGNYHVHREIFTGTKLSFDEIEKKNPYQLIVETIDELDIMVDALIMCANFHRNYFDRLDYPGLEEFESIFIRNVSIIEELKKRQFLYQELRAACDKYFENVNTDNTDREPASQSLKEQLASIIENLKIERGSDDLRFITFNYFDNQERSIIREHVPQRFWRDL